MNFLTLLFAAALAANSPADNNKDDSAALQNAESASIPREIPIGLPEGNTGAVILEDGVMMAQGLVRNYLHWAGGNAYSSTRVMGLPETLIICNQIAMAVDSRTAIGGDDPRGAFTLRTSSNGLIRFDGAVSGPFIKEKGWYFSLGAYVNKDPTSVNAPTRKYVDDKQIYKFCATRKWGSKAELSAMYKLTLTSETSGFTYSVAPYMYDGAGGVTPFNGFRLGRDCYFVDDDFVTYKDVVTGKTKSGNLSKMDNMQIHDFHIDGRLNCDNGWVLSTHLQLCTTPVFNLTENITGGIVKSSGASFTYSDGSAFTDGYAQIRTALLHAIHSTDFHGLVKAHRKFARNELELGFMYVHTDQNQQSSSLSYAHEVCANPKRLYKDGRSSWALNNNSYYLDALQSQFVLYALDDWDPSDRLHLRGGIRFRTPFFVLHNAANKAGQTKFNRYDGFSIADIGGPSELNTFTRKDIDSKIKVEYHAIGALTFKLCDGLFLMGDGFYSMTNKATTYYKGNKIPSLKPIGNALARGGLNYLNGRNRSVEYDVKAIVSYITCWNCAAFTEISNRHTSAQLPMRNMETITYLAEYGIGTLGFTLDGNFKKGGFNLHAMLTWQDPRYKNFDNVVRFSDGIEENISYSGKITTGISKLRIELDPSYSWTNWRVAANIRYFSKQYASKNNLAYFNGHFETFANVDWLINKHCKLSLNVINVLFQNGAKGKLTIADSAASEAELAGTILSGTYIRPFTVDLGFTYKF